MDACLEEVRTFLLDSSIKIAGMTQHGVAASTSSKFNAVTDYLFTPILQPEIRTRALTLLGKTLYGLVSPTHMCLLTDRELITVREEERRSANDKYGGIWDYIPLAKIVELTLSQRNGDLFELSIRLPDVVLKSLYRASAGRELNELLDRFREVTSSGRLMPAPASR